MAQRILVFESDAEFAKEVELNFTNLGAEVEVVGDGSTGLDRAASAPPDLILLSIELPSMNGFLVCKKIKKNAQLRDIPLVILSSDANADEIFEQHKKLRTRAQDYVRKPVTFDALLSRVSALVPLGTNGAAVMGVDETEGTQIEEALVLSEDDVLVEGTDPSPPAADVDDEIDAFAESAFSSLVLDDKPQAPAPANGVASEPPAPLSASDNSSVDVDLEDMVPIEEDAPEEDILTEAELTGDEGAVAAEPPAPPEPAAAVAPPPVEPADRPAPVPVGPVPLADVASGDLTAAQRHIETLEDQLAEARRGASEAESLRRQLAASKSEAPKSGGVSSREFLDLRETVNNKDREILDLKDQLTARDKQLLELRGNNLELERGRADLDDRILELERSQSETRESLRVAEQEQASSAEREQDLKSRLQRAEIRSKQLADELEQERQARSEQVEALSREHAAALAQAEDDRDARVESAKAEHAAAIDSLKENHAEQLGQLAKSHQTALSDKNKAHAEELQTAQNRHEAGLAALRDEHEGAMAEQRLELEEAREAAMAQLRESHSKEFALLGRKLAEAESNLEDRSGRLTEVEAERDKLQQDFEDRVRRLAELEARVAELDESLSVRTRELESTRGELESSQSAVSHLQAEVEQQLVQIAQDQAQRAELDAQLKRAQAKIEGDDELLERARKALAIGLGLLEDQKSNPIDPNS